MNIIVDKAEIICCFMTPDYQNSVKCRDELQYAKEKHKHIIPCMIGDKENKQWKPTDWLESITTGLDSIDFQDESLSNIQLKTEELINRITNQSSTPIQYDLVDVIKKKYLKNDKIKSILNEEDVFSIEQSYINLAMVHTKDKAAKYGMKIKSDLENEQDYDWKHYDCETLSPYEEIYSDKKPIDIRGIFPHYQPNIKQVLILGRSKIGKSTFCQYATYQWANGKMWYDFELVVLIDMLKLTDIRYPPTKHYSLIDLVEKEYAAFGKLSTQEKQSFLQKCNKGRVLWIFDEYDEFTANVSQQLKACLNDILKKQHYIIISSSYDITISYDVKLEITGFLHADILKYVEHFFRQIDGESANTSSQGQKLLDVLYSNRSIYRVASIPVNLELLCRLWTDPNRLETKSLTMAALYETFILWLCGRQISKDNENSEQMTKEAVWKQFDKELQFLEYLAFKTVQNDEVILPLNVLQEAAREVKCDLSKYSRVLQMGILKRYKKKSVETTEQYYFIHPSYQQFFAALYLLRTLKSLSDSEVVYFIRHQKYNERFRLIFIFVAGLLAESDYQVCIDKFWTTIQSEPIDLCGLQHLQLLTECIDELGDSDVFDNRITILNKLWKLYETFLNMEVDVVRDNVTAILSKTSTIPHSPLIQNNLAKLLLNSDQAQKSQILYLMSRFPVFEPTEKLFATLLHLLRDSSGSIRNEACTVLGNISSSTGIKQLTDALVKALSDNYDNVRIAACKALGKLSESAVTDKVITSLFKALGAKDESVSSAACDALVKLAEKVTTNLVLDRLIQSLIAGDVQPEACEALGKIAEKTLTNDIITAFIRALDNNQGLGLNDTARNFLIKFSQGSSANEVITSLLQTFAVHESYAVRRRICNMLIEIAEKTPTNEVLAALVIALGDRAFDVSRTAHEGLMKLGKKALTDEMITGLIDVLRLTSVWSKICFFQIVREMGEKAAKMDLLTILVNGITDEDADVRKNACQTLGKFGEKAATNEVIVGLNNALQDNNADVRQSACEALGNMGDKAATKDVIVGLSNALQDNNADVRKSACEALGKFDEKAATNEVIVSLSKALRDRNIRQNACDALQKIAGKAPVADEVVAVFIQAVDDKNGNVRRDACEALGNIGERAMTAKVITVLIRALGDSDWEVPSNARKALVELNRKIPTYEVITGLNNALGNANNRARKKICLVFSNIGAKAATKDTITVLFNQFTHENRDVQNAACDALEKLGETTVTNELITALIAALVSNDSNIQAKACRIIYHVGEKAATNEVIAALHNTLNNQDTYMEFWVCRALSKIGKKAASDEVIDYLVNTLNRDQSDQDRACETLGNMGEKAITDKVLDSLVNALCGKSVDLQKRACETLGKFGKKAATNRVLLALSNVLHDNKKYSQDMRKKVCKTLGSMGEKAATDEVLAGLVKAFHMKKWDTNIREEVCKTLGKLGEKAATNAVLESLISTIRDKDCTRETRRETYQTFGKFGEKAVTNDVITCLLDILADENVHYSVDGETVKTIVKLSEVAKTNQVIICLIDRFSGKINRKTAAYVSRIFVGAMNSFDAMKDLDVIMIEKLTQCLKQFKTIALEIMPRNQCIRIFLETRNDAWIQGRSQGGCPRCPGTPLGEKIPEGEYRFENLLTKIKKFFAGGHPPCHISGDATAWIPLVQYTALLQNVAMTVMDGQITIYDGKYITEKQVMENELLNVFDKIKNSYAHITIKPTVTSDFDLRQALAGKKKKRHLIVRDM